MRTTKLMTRTAAPVFAALLVLAGCSGTDGDTGGGGGYGAPAEDEPAEEETAEDGEGEMTGASLATSSTDLGTIVVDGTGMTVYQFDDDTQGSGESTCTGDCLAAWPPVPGADDVQADGVTGEIGTITGTDGESQLTLNGWPLYYYASDELPGDTSGQGVNDVWWVLGAEGEPIRE